MFVGCTFDHFAFPVLVAHVLLGAMFPVRTFDRLALVLLANFKRFGRNVDRAMCMLCARHLAADFVQRHRVKIANVLVELNMHTVLSRFAFKVSLGLGEDDFESLAAHFAVRLEFDHHLVCVGVPRIVPRLLPLFALWKLHSCFHALSRHGEKFLLVWSAKCV